MTRIYIGRPAPNESQDTFIPHIKLPKVKAPKAPKLVKARGVRQRPVRTARPALPTAIEQILAGQTPASTPLEDLSTPLSMLERLTQAAARAHQTLDGQSRVAAHQLWSSQIEIFRDFVQHIDDFVAAPSEIPRARIIQPPRTGKTFVAGYCIAETGLTSVFIVPTRALVDQALRDLRAQLPGIPVGVYAGEAKQLVRHGVNVTTYAILIRDFERGHALPPEISESALVFCDEAHRAMTVKRTSFLYGGFDPLALRIALTATPDFDDEQRLLANYFPDLIHEISVGEAVELELLAGLRVWVAEVDVEGSEVEIVNDDYDEATLARIMSAAPFFEAARAYRYDPASVGMGALVCCQTKEQARDFERYVSTRLPPGTRRPALIFGDTPAPKRRRILAAFESGRLDTIINVGVLIEGWSSPRCKLLIDLAPTLSKVRGKQKYFRPMTKDGDKEAHVYVILPQHLPRMPVLPMELFAQALKRYESGDLVGGSRRQLEHDKQQKQEEKPAAVPKPPRVANVTVKSTILIDTGMTRPILDPRNWQQIRRVLESNDVFMEKFVPLSRFRGLFFNHRFFVGRGSMLLQHLGVEPNGDSYRQLMTQLYPEQAATILLADAQDNHRDWTCYKDAWFLLASGIQQVKGDEPQDEIRDGADVPWRDLVWTGSRTGNRGDARSYEEAVRALSGLGSLAPSPDAETERRELARLIRHTLYTLTAKEQRIIHFRFLEDETLSEVAERFEVTVERIRQVEAKALRKLRHPSRSRALRPYVDPEAEDSLAARQERYRQRVAWELEAARQRKLEEARQAAEALKQQEEVARQREQEVREHAAQQTRIAAAMAAYNADRTGLNLFQTQPGRVGNRQIARMNAHGVGFKLRNVHTFTATELIPEAIRGKLRVGMTVDVDVNDCLCGIHDWAADVDLPNLDIGIVTQIQDGLLTYRWRKRNCASRSPILKLMPEITVGSILQVICEPQSECPEGIRSVLVHRETFDEWFDVEKDIKAHEDRARLLHESLGDQSLTQLRPGRVHECQVTRASTHGVSFKLKDKIVFNRSDAIPKSVRGKIRIGMTVDVGTDEWIIGIHDWTKDAEIPNGDIAVVTRVVATKLWLRQQGSDWSWDPETTGKILRWFPQLSAGTILRMTEQRRLRSVMVQDEWIDAAPFVEADKQAEKQRLEQAARIQKEEAQTRRELAWKQHEAVPGPDLMQLRPGRIHEQQITKVTKYGVSLKWKKQPIFVLSEEIPESLRGKLRVGMTVDFDSDHGLSGIHDWKLDAGRKHGYIGVVVEIANGWLVFRQGGHRVLDAYLALRQFPMITGGSIMRLTLDATRILSVLVPGEIMDEWVEPLSLEEQEFSDV